LRTAAVVTVTNGKRLKELEQCVASISSQTYKAKHYILCDGDWDDYIAIRWLYPTLKVCYWDAKIGGNGYAGQRWYAAAPQLITEDVTFFCNDDDWYKPDHVKSIMDKIDEGYDWAYSLRSIYDKDGQLLFDDNCEALGELHDTWNIPGHHFVDWCMWGMKTDYLKQLAILLNKPDPQVDRQFYQAATRIVPNFTATGKHTFCFRMGGSCGVQPEFFIEGNKRILEKFNNKLPWITVDGI
jgi:glycosyltransferase involved in cell wall biosynthesis